MTIPSRQQCFDLMLQESMPLHIVRHSVTVTQVATGLARELKAVGQHLEEILIERASLLHDIGKAHTLGTLEDHGVVGAQIVESRGFDQLAPYIKEHVGLWKFDEGDSLDEGLVVNYADKRVKHDRVVSLGERFVDLGNRYAVTEEMRTLLQLMYKNYQQLERKVFALLSFEPDAIGEHLALDIVFPITQGNLEK